MPRDQDRRQDRGLDPLVVVRVDAHVFLLRRERELTNVKSLGGSVGQVGLQGAGNLLIWASVVDLELMVGLEIRPAPHPAVDHMGKPFPVRHLQCIDTCNNGSLHTLNSCYPFINPPASVHQGCEVW